MEIKEGIKNRYKGELYDVYCDRVKNWAKIVILNHNSINKITSEGLKLLGGIIDTDLIGREIHFNLVYCFKCFSFDHDSKVCKLGQKCVRCGESHSVAQCKNNYLKCVNCEGDHNALALKCRKRKEVIAQKVKDLKESAQKHKPNNYNTLDSSSLTSHPTGHSSFNASKSYADSLKPNPNTQITTCSHIPTLNIGKHTEEEIALYSKMIPNMAQILCDGTEGSFLQKTNELLETNGFNKRPFIKVQLCNNTPIRKDPNI